MKLALAVLTATCMGSTDAATKKKAEDYMHGFPEEHQARMRAHHEEQKHLNNIPTEKISDWTIHKDVDDTYYWFSRRARRSQREPPPGWVKKEGVKKNGGWLGPKPPPRDEL